MAILFILFVLFYLFYIVYLFYLFYFTSLFCCVSFFIVYPSLDELLSFFSYISYPPWNPGNHFYFTNAWREMVPRVSMANCGIGGVLFLVHFFIPGQILGTTFFVRTLTSRWFPGSLWWIVVYLWSYFWFIFLSTVKSWEPLWFYKPKKAGGSQDFYEEFWLRSLLFVKSLFVRFRSYLKVK